VKTFRKLTLALMAIGLLSIGLSTAANAAQPTPLKPIKCTVDVLEPCPGPE
jgi:hypothetical protein